MGTKRHVRSELDDDTESNLATEAAEALVEQTVSAARRAEAACQCGSHACDAFVGSIVISANAFLRASVMLAVASCAGADEREFSASRKSLLDIARALWDAEEVAGRKVRGEVPS